MLPNEERERVLRDKASWEIAQAEFALLERDYATARERLLLALSWLEEIESPKAEVVQ